MIATARAMVVMARITACLLTAGMVTAPAWSAPLAAPVADPRVAFGGQLMVPDTVVDQTGQPVAITGLSGVAWLGDDRYVAVMDNSAHLLLFRLALGDGGRPIAVTSLRIVTLAERHDYEDVAPCPGHLAEQLLEADDDDEAVATPHDDGVVFVCEEDTPAIHACSLADGRMLATAPLPDNLRTRRANRGLEALAIEADGRHLWTANEEALPADGPDASSGGGTVVRLTKLPVRGMEPGMATDVEPETAAFVQVAYRVDPVHQHVRVFAGPVLSGLVALVTLEGGRLLVLERGAAAGLPPFSSRICIVDTAGAVDVSSIDGDLAGRMDAIVERRPLWADSLGLNIEGLCAGPTLDDGSRALVGIADNGGIGTPSQLVVWSLESPAPAVDPAVLGVAAAVIAVAMLTGRIIRP